MASTNKTTNYDLSQFIETDKPGWLTDYNGDMRTIDSTMKSISDVASGASGGISSLTDRMTAAEGAITTNANDITALDARTDALEAGAQSTAGTIANIQTEQTAQNLGIEAATELGYNLARPYDSASTYAVGAYVLFQNTLYKCVTAVSTGEAFDPTKWIAIKATDEIAAGGYTPTTERVTGLSLRNTASIEVRRLEGNNVTLSNIRLDNSNSLIVIYHFPGFDFVSTSLLLTFDSITLTTDEIINVYISHLLLDTGAKTIPHSLIDISAYRGWLGSPSNIFYPLNTLPVTLLGGTESDNTLTIQGLIPMRMSHSSASASYLSVVFQRIAMRS